MFPSALTRPSRSSSLLVAATLVLGALPARAAVTTFAQFAHHGAGTNDPTVAGLDPKTTGAVARDFDGLDVRAVPPASLLPADLPLHGSGFLHRFADARNRALAVDLTPIVVPEADARPALGLLVALAGLGEILRRFLGGWTRAGRVEI